MFKYIARYSNYQAAAGPCRAGPAAAWSFVYLGIYLNIFDIFGYICIYVYYIVGICWDRIVAVSDQC